MSIRSSRKGKGDVATAPLNRKTAADRLQEKIQALIDSAAKRMTENEFRAARQKAEGVIAAVRARAHAALPEKT